MRLRFAFIATIAPRCIFPVRDSLCTVKQILSIRWSPQLSYMASAALTASMSLLLSIVYSRDLGAQNRGIVGMVFLTSLIFATVVLGGLNLTFRSHASQISVRAHGIEFLFLSLVISLIGSLFVVFIATCYSSFKSLVPINFLYVSAIYSFFSIVLSQTFQVLLSAQLISLRWKLELLMVSIQVFTYLLLRSIEYASTAVNVLISLIFSYVLVLFISLWKIGRNNLLKPRRSLKKQNLIDLFSASKVNARYSMQMAILDRLDRVIVLVIFPTAIYGVYSFITGVISFARFLPESFSTLIVAKRLEGLEGRIHFSSSMRRIILVLVAILVGCSSYLVTKITFGTTASISFWIPVLFVLAELLRGAYIANISYLFRHHSSTVSSRSSLFILFVFISLVLLLINWIGISAIPLSLVISYLFGMRIFGILHINKTNNDMNE